MVEITLLIAGSLAQTRMSVGDRCGLFAGYMALGIGSMQMSKVLLSYSVILLFDSLWY